MSGGVEPLVRVTVARADGEEFSAFTRRSGSRMELLEESQPLPRLSIGEEIGLKRPVAGDATYEEPVVVDGPPGPDGAVPVRPSGDRRRHQQREHVRTSVLLLSMTLEEVPDADEQAEPTTMEAHVLDISAGGARIEHEGAPLSSGTLWRVTTELDFDDGSRLPLDLTAEVRWAYDPDAAASAFRDELDDGTDAQPAGEEDGEEEDDTRRGVAGLRFLATPPGLEASVTRWVFQQQAKWLRVRREGR